MDKPDEIKVFISNRESKCDDCGEELGRKAWITLERDKARYVFLVPTSMSWCFFLQAMPH